MNPIEHYNDLLRSAVKKARLSGPELADLLNCSQSNARLIKCGLREFPRDVGKLLKKLGLRVVIKLEER